MHELLHAQAPQDEFDFYLSYAAPDMKILEPLCASSHAVRRHPCPDDDDYELNVSVDTEEGLTLVRRTKNSYDESTRTQFSPRKYELYRGEELLQGEFMDFQTHLYTPTAKWKSRFTK